MAAKVLRKFVFNCCFAGRGSLAWSCSGHCKLCTRRIFSTAVCRYQLSAVLCCCWSCYQAWHVQFPGQGGFTWRTSHTQHVTAVLPQACNESIKMHICDRQQICLNFCTAKWRSLHAWCEQHLYHKSFVCCISGSMPLQLAMQYFPGWHHVVTSVLFLRRTLLIACRCNGWRLNLQCPLPSTELSSCLQWAIWPAGLHWWLNNFQSRHSGCCSCWSLGKGMNMWQLLSKVLAGEGSCAISYVYVRWHSRRSCALQKAVLASIYLFSMLDI